MDLSLLPRLRPSVFRWLSTGVLAPHIDAFARDLVDRGYSRHTVHGYLAGLAHFAQWLRRRRLPAGRIDEALVARFLDEHLPRCDCAPPVKTDRGDLSAALGHLLLLLREAGLIAEPLAQTHPVDEELYCFDRHMDHARGLARKTRSMALRIVGRLLRQRFGDGPVLMESIKPAHVRCFFAQQSRLYRSAVSASIVVSSLRGYFRFREFCGDAVHGLIGAVSYPANWRLASLPKTLAPGEIEQLVHALGQPGRSMRRADAIVRCALDLGLRSGEIATLSLDDIDWRAGIVTLRHTKNRREDVLPLPATTGRAIAAYLKQERPRTILRAVFVRHIAPRNEPFGADGVRKVIRRAYARAGLPYTRSHLLRHTMASRLLASGSSLKEVADVLRHRSLNSTQIYAKLDSRNLGAVCLPWPERAS